MDSESGVDYHYIFLSFRSCIIHDMIENLSCIFRCLSAIQINILITGEAEAFGSVNLFMIAGCHFKLIGQSAKKIKSDAQDRLASIKTEIKDLAAEVKKGTREYHLSSKNTIRFALDGYFLYYSWVNGEFKLVKAEKIPDWDKRSLWAQEDRNRKAMLDLFGIEYPEVERPIDDTEDYGDKFEEDLSDKLPEEEPEDDE